jgi:hypothetical protein
MNFSHRIRCATSISVASAILAGCGGMHSILPQAPTQVPTLTNGNVFESALPEFQDAGKRSFTFKGGIKYQVGTSKGFTTLTYAKSHFTQTFR